ncbi:MAG: methylated-DNA--[protein]-cysteine S-methyltransferase [Planctomycetota bacterium]
MNKARIHVTVLRTRLAPLLIGVDESGDLVAMRFLDPASADAELEAQRETWRERGHAVVDDTRACGRVASAVKDFLAGRSTALDLPRAKQGTPFQNSVWKAVARIGYGKTLSYKELARRIGRPTAVRAVARANATNPCALVIPCHRVIGSDGKATGYNGGIGVKEALLAMEARGAP